MSLPIFSNDEFLAAHTSLFLSTLMLPSAGLLQLLSHQTSLTSVLFGTRWGQFPTTKTKPQTVILTTLKSDQLA